jgi:uncharacterized protein (DUF433 family)
VCGDYTETFWVTQLNHVMQKNFKIEAKDYKSCFQVMNYRDYTTVEPNKRRGKPCTRGLRITVYEILEYLASEMTVAEILEDFPDLTQSDLRACIVYAGDR